MASLTFIIVFCLVTYVAARTSTPTINENSQPSSEPVTSSSALSGNPSTSDSPPTVVETTVTTYDSSTTQSQSGAAIITTIPMRALWKTLLIPLVVVFKIR